MATYLSGRKALASNGTTVFSSQVDWQLNETNALESAVLSNTKFHEMIIPGNTDWSGSIGFAGRFPELFPGDAITLRLYPDGDAAFQWLGTAIVSRVTVECNVEGGNHIKGRIEFLANGALSTGTNSTLTDSSTPNMFTSIGMKVVSVADDGTTATDVPVRGWSLDYQDSCPTYVDTSSSGQIKRNKGNLTFNGSFRVYEGLPANVLRAGAISELRLFTQISPANHYWRVKYAAIGGQTTGASRQTAEHIGVEYPFRYSTHKLISTTMTPGTLQYVGSSTTTLHP